MDLNHLHLHVASLDRAEDFYGKHFGFRRHWDGDGIRCLRNERDFDLIFMQSEDRGVAPWFHFGFRLPGPDEVKACRAALTAAGVKVGEMEEEPAFLSFRCWDPDGYEIEVYWE